MTRERGVVVSWNDREGHGRIQSDAGDVLWAHFSQIQAEGYRTLTAGQRVEFVRVELPGSEPDSVRAYDIVAHDQS